MAEQFTNQYGLKFRGKPNEGNLELNIWRHYDEYARMSKQLLPRHIHMKRAIQYFFPERFILQKEGSEYPQRGYVWNPWMEVRNESWTNNQFQTWWGASATGKSTDSAILALCTWLASPQDTTIIVCSTTSKMLERRIWREVVKFYKMREHEFPGKLVRSKTSIFFDPANPLSGIHGVAVQQGSVEDALGNLVGMHNEHVYLIIDEMQATREAAVIAYDNLSSGAIDTKFLGMGNPMSKLDPLGAYSMPKNGWKEATTDKTRWITKKGVCLYFDGYKSPGVENPVKYPFLLTQKQIDDMKEDPGVDSPRFWTMRRGFLPPDGILWSILTDQMITTYHVQDQAIWAHDTVTVVGIDPAYSSGGDRCIIYPIKVGMDNTGNVVLEMQEPIKVLFEATEKKLMLDQLTEAINGHLDALGVKMENVGMDTTGNQWMLADAVEKAAGQSGMLRVSFGGRASEDPISPLDDRPAHTKYKNRCTELWARFGNFIKNDMIRNMAGTTCKEFCIRQIDHDMKNGDRVVIESKELLRDRLGFSPDEADAAVVGAEVVRKTLGFEPQKTFDVGGITKAEDLEIKAAQNVEEIHDFDGDEFDVDFYEEDYV